MAAVLNYFGSRVGGLVSYHLGIFTKPPLEPPAEAAVDKAVKYSESSAQEFFR